MSFTANNRFQIAFSGVLDFSRQKKKWRNLFSFQSFSEPALEHAAFVPRLKTTIAPKELAGIPKLPLRIGTSIVNTLSKHWYTLPSSTLGQAWRVPQQCKHTRPSTRGAAAPIPLRPRHSTCLGSARHISFGSLIAREKRHFEVWLQFFFSISRPSFNIAIAFTRVS